MGSREAVAMVKIDLITGFLGAGKTTFLKKYAEYLIAKGQNIGILENDFGAVNVDTGSDGRQLRVGNGFRWL